MGFASLIMNIRYLDLLRPYQDHIFIKIYHLVASSTLPVPIPDEEKKKVLFEKNFQKCTGRKGLTI